MSEFRVLIVEDEVDAAEIIESLLAYNQLYTVHVGSAEEAQEALAGAPFDALISDLFLPQMDGLALIKWVRSYAPTSQLPCIAVTAYNSSALRKQALDAGYNRYFAKPVNHEVLIETLQTFLV